MTTSYVANVKRTLGEIEISNAQSKISRAMADLLGIWHTTEFLGHEVCDHKAFGLATERGTAAWVLTDKNGVIVGWAFRDGLYAGMKREITTLIERYIGYRLVCTAGTGAEPPRAERVKSAYERRRELKALLANALGIDLKFVKVLSSTENIYDVEWDGMLLGVLHCDQDGNPISLSLMQILDNHVIAAINTILTKFGMAKIPLHRAGTTPTVDAIPAKRQQAQRPCL